MRLIDADCLINSLKLYPHGSVIGAIEQAPTIDAVPVRHGRWNCDMSGAWCSVCGEYSEGEWNYCPNCGAKMDGENDE